MHFKDNTVAQVNSDAREIHSLKEQYFRNRNNDDVLYAFKQLNNVLVTVIKISEMLTKEAEN